ncbi:hypothetical protein GE09DRAFT_605637 [Coniochaeta sp. 2T2.1]|nr:hypothetical protein GE09DRAFT_605637 [Coniochaeta sp. 2T2.1]
MAGRPRRRRSSNSTAASVDAPHVRYLPESTFLKPVPAEILHINGEWPCFVLEDATVYLKDGRRLANPLFPDPPFVIRGTLNVDAKSEELRRCLVDPRVHSGYIEIEGATLYSIGWGPLSVWVGGTSGWFELRTPSPQFEAIFAEIHEAITLYYELLTIFENSRDNMEEYQQVKGRKKRVKEPAPLDLDTVLLKYAVAVGNGIFRAEAEAQCHKWAAFLINHLSKEEEFPWKGTFFYKWLIEKHPKLYSEHLKKVAEDRKLRKLQLADTSASAPVQKVEPPSRASSVKSQSRNTRSRNQSLDADVEMGDVNSPSPRSASLRHPSRKISNSPVATPMPQLAATAHYTPPPASRRTRSPAQAVQTVPRIDDTMGDGRQVEALLTVMEDISKQFDKPLGEVKHKAVGNKLYMRYKISQYATAEEILEYYSKDLVENLDPKWHGSPFWDWLLEVSKNPPAALQSTTLDKMPHHLTRRGHRAPIAAAAPATRPPPNLEIKSKRQPSQEADLDSDDDESSGRPRYAGKGGLRLQSASKKRTSADMMDSDTPVSGRRARKAAKTSHYINPEDHEDIFDDDDESATSDAASPQAEEDVDEQDDPDGLSMPAPRDAVRVVVHAEKLPSMSPTGPNGTWVCDQEDCGYVVRAAEEAAGRKKIQQHFQEHEAATQKTALAMAEAERRGRMPIKYAYFPPVLLIVNHLLEKIQRMGREKDRETVNGEVVPLPIKRRLIV